MTSFVRPALLLCLLCAAAGCGGEKPAPKTAPPREVAVLTLQPSEVRDTSEYLGTLLSRASVNVFPQVTGYVKKIHVRPGAVVKAGDALVDIDAREESAALQSAVAERSAVQARLELARANFERSEALNKEGLAPAQELDLTRSEVAAASAAAAAASAGVAQREVQLAFHTVRAAIAGTLGEVLVRVGDAVTPATQVTTVAPPPEGSPPAVDASDSKSTRDAAMAAALEVTVAIPAERARSLSLSQPLEILDKNGDVLLSAPIFYAAPQADPRTQLVAVKAAFQNTLGLRPSELVRTRVVYSTSVALQVPAVAVVRQSGQPFVFVVKRAEAGGAAGGFVLERRPVKLGALGRRAYVVESGLQAGEQVAVASLQMLKDGMAIVPKEAAAQAAQPAPPAQRGG